MGWFGSKKDPVADSDYVDVEAMPVAIAVMPEPLAPPAQNPKVGEPTNVAMSPKQKKPNQFLWRIPTMLNPCPCCGKPAQTRIRTAPNWMTFIAVVALMCIFWPICWIPLITDSCKLTEHFCVLCNEKIGVIGPFKDCCVKHRTCNI
jgi:hypothetical protein